MLNKDTNNNDLKEILKKMANEEIEEKNNPQVSKKKGGLLKFNLPYWLKFGWLFWAISFFSLLIPSWLWKKMEGGCDLVPDITCIPKVLIMLFSLIIAGVEYPVNIVLEQLDPYYQFYSENLVFQFDLPKILLISLLFLLIGILIGFIVGKISKKIIEYNKKKPIYLSVLVLIILISVLIQIQNYLKHSNFNTTINRTLSQSNTKAKKEILSYKINSYKNFEESLFCKFYKCYSLGTIKGDRFHKYKIEENKDCYIEIKAQNNQLESILVINWDIEHRMKGDDFKLYFDLLRSIDSSLAIDDPNDSVVDYIISHAYNNSLFGKTEAITWGPIYTISVGRDGGNQGMYIWKK